LVLVYKLYISIFKGVNFIGGGTKIDGLFKIDLDPNFENNHLSLHTNVGTKRSFVNENSALLWHRRLGHISIKRKKRLVNNGILKALTLLIMVLVWIA
jgi:hypothetical protein